MERTESFTTEFKKMFEEMTPTGSSSYNTTEGRTTNANRNIQFTKEKAEEIIKGGDPAALRSLSSHFFYRSGYYRRLIFYYATLMMNNPMFVPVGNVSLKQYNKILLAADSMRIKAFLQEMNVIILSEGAVYGLLCGDSDKLSYLKLPYDYCRSRFSSYDKIDLVELNLSYFDKINDKTMRAAALSNYPSDVVKAYEKYKKGKIDKWYMMNEKNAFHFCLYDDRPFFASVIPAIIDFDEYKTIEKLIDLQRTQKILVQRSPHTSAGELLFEPTETKSAHAGGKKMVSKLGSLEVLTTYMDTELLDLTAKNSVDANSLEQANKVIYSEAGVSKELFAADKNVSMQNSILNDISLMSFLSEIQANWLEVLLNNRFGTRSFRVKVKILPVSLYNQDKYVSASLNMAKAGYSFIEPVIAQGMSQLEFENIKNLENDVLKLHDRLIPLATSYTQSAESTAAKTEEEITDKTIQNKNTGGQ